MVVDSIHYAIWHYSWVFRVVPSDYFLNIFLVFLTYFLRTLLVLSQYLTELFWKFSGTLPVLLFTIPLLPLYFPWTVPVLCLYFLVTFSVFARHFLISGVILHDFTLCVYTFFYFCILFCATFTSIKKSLSQNICILKPNGWH